MDIVYALANHPVYGTFREVLESIRKRSGGINIDNSHRNNVNTHVLLGDNRLFFKKTEVKFVKTNLHVLNSPLVSFECWEALVGGYPALLCEEYYQKSRLKDAAVSLALFPFKGYPFISQTKRTHEFLTKRGFSTFHVPPGCKKHAGSRKRGFFLFVSKMIESKNPFLVVEIAKLMPKEKFVLIGSGTLLGEVRKRARSLGNIELIESVNDRDEIFSEYFGKAKALIHPARSDPIGFVVIEALSCATPVLCSSGVGASDYLPSEWRMDRFDAKSWAEKLEEIANGGQEKAAELFHSENLDSNSPYFGRITEEILKFMEKKGWNFQ